EVVHAPRSRGERAVGVGAELAEQVGAPGPNHSTGERRGVTARARDAGDPRERPPAHHAEQRQGGPHPPRQPAPPPPPPPPIPPAGPPRWRTEWRSRVASAPTPDRPRGWTSGPGPGMVAHTRRPPAREAGRRARGEPGGGKSGTRALHHAVAPPGARPEGRARL